MDRDWSGAMNRRRLLEWAGGLGLAAFLPGCSRGGGTATGTTTSVASADCVLMPELTEGPFYLDLDLVRKDITAGRPGMPLDLRVNVVDVASSCAPLEDAAVDIWHADAGGEYSGVEDVSGTFLRGIQTTGRDGEASFRTIYPGWYSGRAVHVHVKVHVGSNQAHTGQLFFDEGITDAVYATEPYSSRPGPDVRNESDAIFAESQSSTIVSVEPGGGGYEGLVTLGVQRV